MRDVVLAVFDEWCVVLDEPLITLRWIGSRFTHKHTPHNFTILVRGRYRGVVFDLILLVPSTTEKWCMMSTKQLEMNGGSSQVEAAIKTVRSCTTQSIDDCQGM